MRVSSVKMSHEQAEKKIIIALSYCLKTRDIPFIGYKYVTKMINVDWVILVSYINRGRHGIFQTASQHNSVRNFFLYFTGSPTRAKCRKWVDNSSEYMDAFCRKRML